MFSIRVDELLTFSVQNSQYLMGGGHGKIYSEFIV